MRLKTTTTVRLSSSELEQAVLEWIAIHSCGECSMPDAIVTFAFEGEDNEPLQGAIVAMAERAEGDDE